MQKIPVVQKDAGEIGQLDEASDAALSIRLDGGETVAVSRDDLEPLADGTLLLRTPLAELQATDAQASPSVRAAATVSIAGNRLTTEPGLAPREPAAQHDRVLSPGEVATVPRVEERLIVEKVRHEQGNVRVHVTPIERRETVSVPVTNVHAEVRRVPVGRIVDAAPPLREEGDTVIVSVVDEVLVVEKRLLLREEIHIVRQTETRVEERQVSLLSERVEITRSED
jgi:stress response protein YsnF